MTQVPAFSADLSPEKLAFSKFIAYVGMQNPNYEITPFHALIAENLEAVEQVKIPRLLIFAPPRHGKTNLVSEYFPAWYLGRNPHHHIIFTTYSFDRAKDVGRRIRNQLRGRTHKAVFPQCSLSPDSKGVSSLTTEQGGMCVSVGIGGAITGRGANLFLIDDPIKSREIAESELARKKIASWFESVAYTRLMPPGLIILVQTRWHWDDLSGYLLNEKAHEGWHVIDFPAIAIRKDILGRMPGEALWPNRYPIDDLLRIQKTIGTREWNSQYQQRPVPDEGGLVQLGWFQYYHHNDTPKIAEDFIRIACSWDTAYKPKEIHDPSTCTVWGITQSGYYLLNVINERLEYPGLKRRVKMTWKYYFEKYGKEVFTLIEDQGSGQSLIQDFKKETDIPIIATKTKGDKVLRMSEVSSIIEAGQVFLPSSAPWLVEYETQISQFPYGKYDDMVDATSQFLKWVKKPRYRRSKVPLYWK